MRQHQQKRKVGIVEGKYTHLPFGSFCHVAYLGVNPADNFPFLASPISLWYFYRQWTAQKYVRCPWCSPISEVSFSFKWYSCNAERTGRYQTPNTKYSLFFEKVENVCKLAQLPNECNSCSSTTSYSIPTMCRSLSCNGPYRGSKVVASRTSLANLVPLISKWESESLVCHFLLLSKMPTNVLPVYSWHTYFWAAQRAPCCSAAW